jgi:hypothetical protein
MVEVTYCSMLKHFSVIKVTGCMMFKHLASMLYRVIYGVRQKYLMIWQHSCEWNRWCGEFVLERPSSETQSILVAMERWSVEDQSFAVETYLKNNDCVLTRDISSALQYSLE